MKTIFRALLFLPLFFSGAAMATEEPKYIVESKTAHYEIRKYSATLVAETQIEAKFDEAGNQAFRILANYIFGNNQSKTKVAMTAPVTQQPAQTSSEKIAMTAPVNQIKNENGFLVQFTMPEKFTMATIPVPKDSRVKIREIPAQRVAVYKYSGGWSESRYNKKLAKLRSELQKDGLQTVGEPVFARYNPPFQLWFLRRNEIWLSLAP
jgi:effector-binding domain-containing protein